MIANRSVPTDSVLPHVVYDDPSGAVDWLSTNFGFVEQYRASGDDGRTHVAQLRLGQAYVMIRGSAEGAGSPARLGFFNQSLTVFLEDVEAHFAQIILRELRVTEDLNDTAYGERQYGVLDVEGHRWLFSQHIRDVDPSAWATTPSDASSRSPHAI